MMTYQRDEVEFCVPEEHNLLFLFHDLHSWNKYIEYSSIFFYINYLLAQQLRF